APLSALHVGVGIGFGFLLSREERATRERELHAPLERIRLRRLMAAFVHRALIEVAVTAEPAERASANASRHLVDIVLRGRRRLMDAHAAIAGLVEDAVDGERV